jgi:hypothetical protein
MDGAADDRTPVTYDTCDQVSGPFLHGTKATLEPGVDLVAGHASNFQDGRVSNNIYFTTLESTAAWGAQLAAARAGLDDRGHIYVVEPLGPTIRGRPQRHRQAFPGQSHAVVPDTVRPAGDRGTRRLAGSPARGHDNRPLRSAAWLSAASTRAHTPSSCQHANRAYTRHHGPYRTGTSRHGQPTRTR